MSGRERKFPVFVGHVFKPDQLADLREALKDAFSEFNIIKLVYADTSSFHGALFQKIMRLIDGAMFCIFDISEQNPNVFLELGYAIGRRKLCVPIIRAEATVPSDIAWLELINYSSYKGLTDILKEKIPGILGRILGPIPKEEMGHIEFIRYLRNHKVGQEVDTEDMKKELRKHGISSFDIDNWVEKWVKNNLFSKENGKIIVMAEGEDIILKLDPDR